MDLSKRHSIFAGENCIAELYATSMGLKSGLAIRNLMVDAGLIKAQSIRLRVDNKSAMMIAENLGSKKNSKHYSTTLLFINDNIKRKEVVMEYVPTAENVADLYTKFVVNPAFYMFRERLGLINTNNLPGARFLFGGLLV